jgi:predicted nucleic acid-binding protein
MSRIYWDTMLFVYLLEGHPVYKQRTEELLDRSYQRGDLLFTSYLSLGEIMVGAENSFGPSKAHEIREVIEEMGFAPLPFDSGAVIPFSHLRVKERLKIADSIHLACAASAGIDLFLTGDKRFSKLNISGIQFIADFNNPLF